MNGHWKPNDVFYPCSWCRSWPPPLSWTSKASGYLLSSRSWHPWGTAPPVPAPPWLYQQNKQKSITNHKSEPVSVKKSRTVRNYIWNNSQKVIQYSRCCEIFLCTNRKLWGRLLWNGFHVISLFSLEEKDGKHMTPLR